ncbi:MAG: FtsK/SpoIIIE domain-containing protein [Ilumatobacteraceae bacterium]
MRLKGLPVRLVLDEHGKEVALDLVADSPLFVFGRTGAGKSNALHQIICEVVERASADEVSLVLVDPKRIEFGVYAALPHLRSPVVDVVEWRRTLTDLRGEVARRRGSDDSEPDADILLIVDAAELLEPSMHQDHFNELDVIAEYGPSVGVHLVVAAQARGAERTSEILEPFSVFALDVTEMDDSSTVIGVPDAANLDRRGHGLLRRCGEVGFIDLDVPLVTDERLRAATSRWPGDGS